MLLLIGFVVQGHIPVFQFQYMCFKAIIIIISPVLFQKLT